MTAVRVLAPMRIEAAALRRGIDGALPVDRTGLGPGSAAGAVRAVGVDPAVILLAGLCGAVAPDLRPGDVVLADAILGPGGERIRVADPSVLAGILTAGGLTVHVGPVASRSRIVAGPARVAIAAEGAIAVDMESGWVAGAVAGPQAGRQLTVLRVVLDTPADELWAIHRTLAGLRAALGTLSRVGALLPRWAALAGPRQIVLAAPRASCAGVDRAVEIVERVLDDRGAPVYVRRQIVHNAHVVAALEARGAVFVAELDEVPVGATVVLSAHGVAPAVREQARARGLDVVDATCPLVAKVHREARRFAASGREIVLVGHAGHEEVVGTFGEAPDRTAIVSSVEDVSRLDVLDPDQLAYLTQTTLAVDETRAVIDALRARFPRILGPAQSDICYATQNRQDAVRALADDSDLVLVVGSANSSNSLRLVEVARRSGARAALVEDAGAVDAKLLAGTRTIGVSAGASAPESLVQGVVRAIRALGETPVSELRVAREEIHFTLPPELRNTEVMSCP